MKKAMQQKQVGFTLIEVMITVTILAIVASIALPSYFEQVSKSRRTDGLAAINSVYHTLERCYSRFGRYDDDNCAFQASSSQPSEEGYYVVTGTISANSFSLVATAQSPQDADKCGNIGLDQSNQFTVSGAGMTPETCW